MTAQQRIVRVRRSYNQWVANETLEDFALRFTAKRARKWSNISVANTAIGAVSFLALEAIGGSIAINYGFVNATSATLLVGTLIFLTGLPIAYYAATYGVDIDLLTRGAGFGYIGSTITSLIYASFTFLFFAIEAAIMSLALEMCFGIPLFAGYVLSSLIVIPLVTHGITFISRLQLWTQPVWIVLHLIPFVFIAFADLNSFERWTGFSGIGGVDGRSFNLVLFGTAATVVFSLIAQIGEQVDFLRFLPPPGSRGAPELVDRLFVRRSRLDRPRRAEDAGGVVPGFSRHRTSGPAAERRRTHADVSGRVRIRVLVAAARARVHRRFRHHFADQDQRHQRLCRFDRVVELLLAPHPQPSGPRGVARLQCHDRAHADGARHLQDARAYPWALLHRGGRLGRRAGGRPRHQQAARPQPCRNRIQARPSLRHQPGGRRSDAGRDRCRDRRVLRRARDHAA